MGYTRETYQKAQQALDARRDHWHEDAPLRPAVGTRRRVSRGM